MKTLIELKQAAESKGLRFEVNKWDPTIRRWETDKVPNPDFMKIEIGIEYRPNIWAWFDGFCKEDVKDDDLTLFFRETYNQVCGRQNKTWRRGFKVEDLMAINMMAAACKNKSFYKQIGEANDDEDDD